MQALKSEITKYIRNKNQTPNDYATRAKIDVVIDMLKVEYEIEGISRLWIAKKLHDNYGSIMGAVCDLLIPYMTETELSNI